MTLSIRRADPWDEDEMDVLQAQYVEAQRAEVPDAHVYSRADSVAFLRSTDGPVFYHAFVAVDAETIVGQAWTVGGTIDNLHRAHLWAWVPPPYGRRGVGTALVQHAERHLRDLGRRTAVTQTWIGTGGHGGFRAFAERLGYSLAQTEVERRQRLPMDEATLAHLEAEVATHASAYGLRTVVGPVPEALVDGYVDVYNLLDVEAPSDELEVEEGRWTPVELAAQEKELHDQGRTRVTSFALDQVGTVVAYSCATVGPPDRAERSVDQRGTLVLPDHRGHRLGLAVKCALTRAIQESFPEAAYVRTQNAETNAPMVAINEAMGFEIHSVEGAFHKHLV